MINIPESHTHPQEKMKLGSCDSTRFLTAGQPAAPTARRASGGGAIDKADERAKTNHRTAT